MYKFFCYFLFVLSCINSYAYADFDENNSNKEVEVFVKKIEKNIVQLPKCNDDGLIEKTKEFIISYYDENTLDNVLDKRRKHFIIKNIKNFEEESIANYKTEDTRPVSDVIANLLLNEGILEENMRLCRNNSKNKEASQMYILVYSDGSENNFRVNVLNLLSKNKKNAESSFVYQK